LRDDIGQLGEGAMQSHRPGGGERDIDPEFRRVRASAESYRTTGRWWRHDGGGPYFDEPLRRSPVVAPAVSVILKIENS
jgi:hypothetical protein